jgi:catechol 2,3-dioxygenase-like lactoylglutathione lyase family enzyme
VIRGIHHTAVSCIDLERSLAFYRDLLGFEVCMDFSWSEQGDADINRTHQLDPTAARVVMLRAGNAMLELFQYTAPEPREADPTRRLCDRGITHFCLDVDDIDAEYERLSAAGMRFHCAPVDYGTVKCTYGRDPDGNVIELQEVKSPEDPLALDGHGIEGR